MTFRAPRYEVVEDDPYFAWEEIADRLLDGKLLRLTWDDADEASDLHVRRVRVYGAMKRRGIRVTTKVVDGGLHVRMKGRIQPEGDVVIVTDAGPDRGDAA